MKTKKTDSGNLETLMTDLAEISSTLESCGKQYLKLGQELAFLTSTLSTQPTVSCQKLKESLDYVLWGLISVTRSISRQTKIEQPSAVFPQSTLSDTMSGETPEWFKTWSDCSTTYLNSLSDMLHQNLEKQYSLLKEKDQSA